MLDQDEIDDMRETMREAMPDLATVQRKQVVSDGGGGETETWTDLAPNVPCRFSPVAGGEAGTERGRATVGGRAVDESTHIVTVEAERDVTERDRLLINGEVYEVLLVRRRDHWELSRRLEVRKAP